MSKENAIPTCTRCIGVNATLSTVSTTAFTMPTVNSTIATTALIEEQTQSKKTELENKPQKNNISSQQVKNDMKENKKSDKTTKPQQSITAPMVDKSNVDVIKNKVPVSKLSVVAIALTLALGGFLYFQNYQQSEQQKQTIAQLRSEISSLKESLQQEITEDITLKVANAVTQQNEQFASLVQKVDDKFTEQSQSQQQFFETVNDALTVTEKNMLSFNERLGAMSNTDNNVWLISQANYLVNLAGRKIWNDQDYISARLLLKNADASLAQANDPSLLPARQAINNDIAALAKISYTDFDGIVMTLMGLADSVTELPLVEHYKSIDLGMLEHDDSIVDEVIVDKDSLIEEDLIANNTEEDQANDDPTENNTDIALVSNDEPLAKDITTLEVEQPQPAPQLVTNNQDNDEISFSIGDWSSNLWKSSRSFFAQFIEVEKYDSFGECIADAGQNIELLDKCKIHKALITPEQSLYLRENIRLRLLIASQAVTRHQELIYQNALNDVNIWVNAYFDTTSPNVKVFLSELTNMQEQSVSNLDVPEQLLSTVELNKLMQSRVRSMLAN